MKRHSWKRTAAIVLTAAMLSGNLTQAMSITAFAAEDEVAFDVQEDAVEETVEETTEEVAPEEKEEEIKSDSEEELQEVATPADSETDVELPVDTVDPIEEIRGGELTFAVTILYQFENEEEAAEPVVLNAAIGETIETEITSPEIEGYTPDQETVEIIATEDLTVTVTYVADEQEAVEEKVEEKTVIEMPAQSFSGSAGGVRVSASVAEGVLPAETEMVVRAATASEIKSIEDQLGGNADQVSVRAVDISFVSEDEETQPQGVVDIRLSTNYVAGDQHNMVHLDDNGNAEIIGGASATFASASVGHFSVYGIISTSNITSLDEYARYTYIFKVKGQEVDRQIVKDGEKVTLPAAPLDKGFTGWRIVGESENMTDDYTANIPNTIKGDKEFTVEAQFSKVYYATFYKDAEKSGVLQIKEGVQGAEINCDDVTFQFQDGKAIVGWRVNVEGEPVTTVTLNSNIDLIPVLSSDAVQIKFVTGEGTPVAPVFVEKGKTLTKPADPTRSGYEFKGWFTDSACTQAYDFGTAVDGAFTLYAKWEGAITSYKVVYWKQNANDEKYTFVEMENKTGNAGTDAKYSTKPYRGFTLNTEESDKIVIIKGDGTTIKNVYYDRNKYDLKFYVQGNNNNSWQVVKTYTFKYEQDTSSAWEDIEKTYQGYLWYVGKDDTVAWSSAPAMQLGGIKAYGKKESGTSKIYYYEYINGKKTTTKVKPEFTVNRIGWDFTEEDYVLIPGFTYAEVKDEPEWNRNRRGEATSQKTPGKLYYTRNSYGLQFVTNGGEDVSGGNLKSGIKYEDSLVDYNPSNYQNGITKTKNGITYTFAGWYNNEALTGEVFNFNSKMPALEAVKQSGDKATLVLYAKWTAGEHTVTFNLDGGTFDGNDEIAPMTTESGTTVTAPDSSKLAKDGGYVFGYWKDESGNRFSFDSVITKDITLTAHWNSDNTKILKVVYDVNGGTGTIEDKTEYQAGSYAVIKGQPKAPKGKYFKGWKVGDSDVIIAGGSFEMKVADAENGVVTLTAQYEPLPKYPTTVVYDANGGKINGEDTYTDNNAVVNGNYTIDTSIIPVREDYTFKGWNTNGSDTVMFAKGVAKEVVSGTSGNILYAVWELSKISITVDITGNTATEAYDGTEQTASGWTATSSGSGFDPDKFSYNGKDSVSGTDAGTYTQALDPDKFRYNDSKYNVTFIVKSPVTLTISKRNVTLTSATAEKEFDGTPLKNGNVTVSGDGFVNGEGATYNVTGSQTLPGSSENTFTYTLDNSTKAENYNITKKEGTLTVTLNETALTISGKSYNEKYDGKKHGEAATASVDGATISYSTDDGATWSTNVPKITDVGTVKVKAKAELAGYKTAETTYTLTVTKRNVTLTSADAKKVYDSTPLTNSSVTVSGDGFVNGEGATYNVTGSQTLPGSSDNTFTYTLNNNTKAENYNITKKEGTLTVTLNETALTISGKSYNEKYDGKEHGEAATASVDGATISYSTDDGATWSTNVPKITDVDTVNVKAKAELVGYKTAETTYTLNVTPATLTITTDSASKVYDGTPLTAKADITGLVNGETATVTATGSQTEVGSSNNTYDITWGTAKESNYTITETLGTLEVTLADALNILTFTVDDESKVYGDADPVFTASATVSGMDGYTAQVLGAKRELRTDGTYAENWLGSEVAGKYDIVLKGADAQIKIFDKSNTDVTKNFDLTKVKAEDTLAKGTLTITKRNLTITIEDQEVPLADIASVVLSYTTNGQLGEFKRDGKEDVVQKDALSILLNNGNAITAAGKYQINASLASGKAWNDLVRRNPYVGDSYNITIIPGSLTVTAPEDSVVPEDPTDPTEPAPTPDPAPTPAGGDDPAPADPAPAPAPAPAAGDPAAVLGARRGEEVQIMDGDQAAVLGARRGARTGDDSMMIIYLFILLATVCMIADRYTTVRRMKQQKR